MMKRAVYSWAGWRWLLHAARHVKNGMEAAELFYIIWKD